jgi:hypothetical protein
MSKTKEYRVVWKIDIEADSPRRAAEYARWIQKDPSSTATLFEVVDTEDDSTVEIDLLENNDE